MNGNHSLFDALVAMGLLVAAGTVLALMLR